MLMQNIEEIGILLIKEITYSFNSGITFDLKIGLCPSATYLAASYGS